jgi:uncharacterized membrane protein YphA (DoxX/SURF4 family)
MSSPEWLAHLLLRIGLAFAFLFPPLNAFFDPDSWIGYFPPFLHGILPDLVMLHGFGIVEILIALWIFSGKHIFWPCLLAAIMLLTIIVFNTAEFQVLFRDLSIITIALALALLNLPERLRLARP